MASFDPPGDAVIAYASPEIPPAPPASLAGRVRHWLKHTRPEFQVGTLKYTGLGMVMVFVWLLWGDFFFSLLDLYIPEILPLKLNAMGAGDTANAMLNKTVAAAVAFLLAPIVSVYSDRTRTRWGRRIPYLLVSTPFVGLFLLLIGFHDSIARFFAGGAHPLLVLGILIVGWDFANIFVNTIYYYLFNDVVPARYLSRFLALFRTVFLLAGMAYGKWIFPHSMSHFRAIFVCAGIAYVVGFTLMCLFIREGSYPPPPPNIDRQRGFVSSVKTYARECFTHRLYWYFFLANTCTYTSRLASTFIIVRNVKSLGLTMNELGSFKTWVAGIALLLQFPSGWVADRWHPLRVYIIATIWFTLGTLGQCVWIFKDFGHDGNLQYLWLIGLASLPVSLIAEASELPMYMRLLPKERYGQFCSANGMVRAFALMFGSILAGIFIGSMEDGWGERRFTWLAGWQVTFQLCSIVFLILLYRQWKRHGGDECYTPPLGMIPCNT